MRIEWFLIWTNLNSLHPRVLFATFVWNWHGSPWEEDFKILWTCLVLLNYLPLHKVEQTWTPFIQSEIGTVVMENILNFINVFSLFRYYLPLWNRVALHLNKLKETPSPKDAFAKFGWKWPCGSREEDFYNSSMYFCYFVISPWKRKWPFIWKNFNPFHPRKLCAKFGCNWPCGSGGEYF